MCITTFLHDSELNIPTSCKVLNETLLELRKLTKKDWQVIEHVHVKERFFRKAIVHKSYELYVYVGGCGPWQLINFFKEGTGTTINTVNSNELVIAYMYGMLGGLAHDKS